MLGDIISKIIPRRYLSSSLFNHQFLSKTYYYLHIKPKKVLQIENGKAYSFLFSQQFVERMKTVRFFGQKYILAKFVQT